MNLPNFDTNTISLIVILLSLGTLSLVGFLVFKINRFEKEQNVVSSNKKIQQKIGSEIEDLVKERLDDIFKNSSSNVDKQVNEFISDMTKIAQEKASQIAAYVEKAEQEHIKESQFFVANMLSKIEKEAEEYRKNKLLKVDEQIRQIVLASAREVIGRAISFSEHEDLVSKALEKAKKDRIFG